MLDNKLNCTDRYCKHSYYDLDKDIIYCKLSLDINNRDDCEYFEPRKCCDDCIHAKRIIFETGMIDEIDYYCTLQDNKLIYEDLSFEPLDIKWPQCAIGLYEEQKQ